MLSREASDLVRYHTRFGPSMMASHISAYLFVEWEEEKQHSVIDSKRVEGSSFKSGERVTCKLQDGEYYATILGAGHNACVISPYPISYTDDFRYQNSVTRCRLKWRKWLKVILLARTCNLNWWCVGRVGVHSKNTYKGFCVNAGSSDGGTSDSEKETKKEEKEGGDKNGKIEAATKN